MDNDGDLFRHETSEGLAALIGTDGSTLVRTINEYNGAIERGSSAGLATPRTGKPRILRAPFYGLKVVPGITFTMGGILVNGRCEVLDTTEKTIPGLYAAGDCIGGLMGGYRGGYAGGLIQAIVTGILAGENAGSR